MTGAAYGLGAVSSISDRINALVAANKVTEIAQVDKLPPGVLEVSIDQVEKTYAPWYKRWWIWALAGSVVLGGTVIVLRRGKRRKK